jgi:hypothetical protein
MSISHFSLKNRWFEDPKIRLKPDVWKLKKLRKAGHWKFRRQGLTPYLSTGHMK